MRARLSRLAGIIALLALFISMLTPASSYAQIKIEPEIAAKINQNGSAGYLIYFRAKAKLVQAATLGRKAQGEFVVSSLQKSAKNAQAGVRTYLDAHKVQYTSFWIDNIIVVEKSDKAVLDGLMQFSEIESIKARRVMKLHEPVERGKPAANKNVPMAVEPNITHVKANQVWALGITGSGVVVANIDTGVRYTHQALVNHYRGNLGGGSYNHNYSWYDPYGDHPSSPADDNGHGSHTMGTIVGDDGGSNQIGMAPGAQWIACRGCSTSSCTDTALLSCAQFMAAPTDLTGANPDASKRPNVVNNSWGDCGQSYDDWYKTVIDNWQAAGIYPVFSNGNSSNCGYSTPPPCNTVGNPGRYGNVTGVGSTGQSNGQYATHSNLGPTDDLDTINPNGYASIKPQVAAPGVNIRSSVPDSDSSYEGGWSGTSMSAPHVTGLIALMLQAAPCLTYSEAETIIEQTAYLDTTGLPTACTGEGPDRLPNQATGWGEIDALAAVNQALSACGPAGTLNGTVTDNSNSNPIAGATVRVGSRLAKTNTTGQYAFARLPVGTYSLTAASFGYDNGTALGVVIAEDATTKQNFSLTPKAQVTVSGTVTDGSGHGWPLHATIDIETEEFSTTVVTDPVTGQYSVNLVEETGFTFSVRAEGYTTETATVTTGTGTATHDFILSVDTDTCSAPGYKASGLYQNFEIWPLTNWNVAKNVDGLGWDKSTAYDDGNFTGGTGLAATVDSNKMSGAGYDTELRTPVIDPAGLSSLTLSYKANYQQYASEALDLEISNNNGLTWTTISHWTTDHGTSYSTPGETVTVDLTPYVAGPFILRWRYYTAESTPWDWYAQIDEVSLDHSCTLISSGGLVTGTVYNADTELPLPGAQVTDHMGGSAKTNASGMYLLYSSSGTKNIRAMRWGFDNATTSVSVIDDKVTGQNFYLLPASTTTTTVTTATACVDNDADGYFVGEGCTPEDCNDNDAFYNEVCPNCEVKIIPKALGWFLGEKEKTRRLLVIGKKGTEFDETTPVRWENNAITVVSQNVFFKRFMFMKVSIDGAALDKGDYRALIGTCSATLALTQ